MDENPNFEQEGQEAAQQVTPPVKKPNRKPLMILAVVVLLALVGYGVYAWQNNRVAQLESQVSELKKETAAEAKPIDQYAGWKSTTMKYEKLSFKYPASYSIDVVSTPAEPHEGLPSDRVSLVGLNKFNIAMQTGMWGVGGGCEKCKVVYSEPITVFGKTYHLNYVSDTGSEASVGRIILANDADNSMDFLKAKTILNGDGSPSLMSFTVSYQPNGTDTTVTKSLTFLKNDEQVKQAKLVLQSLNY